MLGEAEGVGTERTHAQTHKRTEALSQAISAQPACARTHTRSRTLSPALDDSVHVPLGQDVPPADDDGDLVDDDVDGDGGAGEDGVVAGDDHKTAAP